MSIGGWSYSPNFANICNQTWRDTFVRSAVRLVEDVGLDGWVMKFSKLCAALTAVSMYA